jgi:hypothetical protein
VITTVMKPIMITRREVASIILGIGIDLERATAVASAASEETG